LDPDPGPNPLVRGTDPDPHQNVTDPHSVADPDPNPDPHVFGPPGSGSISQRHGSADPDPDPHQNVMDPQHWIPNTDIYVLEPIDDIVRYSL
jgi:hypothetical protein